MKIISWVYLFISAGFEIGWVYCLKFMDLKKIFSIGFNGIIQNNQSLILLIPVIGYAITGIGNIIFFYLAMKEIPTSVAFAAWMAITLSGVKVIDTVVFKEGISTMQYISFALIIIGIIGLKKTL